MKYREINILVILEKIFFLIGILSFILSIALIAIFKFKNETEVTIFISGIIISSIFIIASNKILLFDKDFTNKNTIYFDSKIQSKDFKYSNRQILPNVSTRPRNINRPSSVKQFRSK